jgi:phosphoglycolate phosphatase-like HAD superfamily hydrolase
MVRDHLNDAIVVFWDFDGVIKESIAVKTEAFARLFAPFGPSIVARVREHHQRNGGMSRLQKIPLYLAWAGQLADATLVAEYCDSFSVSVCQAVIDSAWVPGAREYLESNCERQRFVLITATPQAEIERILVALQLRSCFRQVHGAPAEKGMAVAAVLAEWNCPPTQALVVGDSTTDYEAALTNRVSFLLRRTPLNLDLQQRHRGLQCDDFKAL